MKPFNPFIRGSQYLPLVVLAAVLVSGCNSAPGGNTRVYDRYAELLAVRRTGLEEDTRNADTASPRRSKSEPEPAMDRRPIPAAERPSVEPRVESVAPAPAPAVSQPRPEPVAKPAPPVQVIAPTPALANPLPETAAAPERLGPIDPEPASSDATPDVSETDSDVGTDGVAYTLKKGDLVQVFLRGIPNADRIEAIIDERGRISLPFINEVVAEGQTASELGRSVRRIYQEQGIYRNISVNVQVPTRYYFVQGETRGPGRYQLVTATRLSQAIAGAGGYTEFASGRVVVKRGGSIYKTIRNARRLERNPQDDILLEPDDIIELQRSRW